MTAVFGWLTAAGASRMKAAKTLELYADTAEGFDWHKGLSLSMLADLTHKKKTKALKTLRKFIHRGWLSAWLDEKNDKLYLTAEDYRAAQENQPQPEPEKAPEQAGEVPLNLETTRRFAQVLEKEQELMEDERAVEELQHMQKTTESICAWLEATPRACPRPAALRNTISPPPSSSCTPTTTCRASRARTRRPSAGILRASCTP